MAVDIAKQSKSKDMKILILNRCIR